MNKLVATLATTTVLFAGTTLYFWSELRARDSTAEALAATDSPINPTVTAKAPAPAPTEPAVTAELRGAAAGNVAGAKSPATDAVKSSGRNDPNREVMLPFAKDFLRQYDNPALRQTLLRAARTGIESQYSRLRDRLKLDANTYSQLVDLLTEEQLDGQANYYRCLVNPLCDTSKMPPTRDRSEDFLALLGAEKNEQLTAYRKSLQDWQAVVQLRGRLPETNNLRDSDAERLMNAMTAERERYIAESGQAGANIRGWGNGAGMMWYTGDGGIEEQMASATQYSERLRQSAATILNAEQLHAFVQLQEELLAGLASYLQSQSGKSD
jgi:hypothetical protein